jgi:large subunit ribosomal protein L36e
MEEVYGPATGLWFLSPLLLFFSFSVLASAPKMCREIADEVVGLSPYERRILDMIKTRPSADKRVQVCQRDAKPQARLPRERISNVNAAQRARQAGV